MDALGHDDGDALWAWTFDLLEPHVGVIERLATKLFTLAGSTAMQSTRCCTILRRGADWRQGHVDLGTYMGRLEESLPLMRQFVRGAIGEMTNAQLRAAERAMRRRRYTGESKASEATLWRLDQELLEARDFLQSGQIKQARGFRQFLLRGLEAMQAEWALICTTHNITKLAKAI